MNVVRKHFQKKILNDRVEELVELKEKTLKRKNLVELKEKKQATERFKGEITYTLLFCVLLESFRGGGGVKILELILKSLL